MRIRWSVTAFAAVSLVMAVVVATAAMPRPVFAQGSSSYESPTFGYTVKWEPTWAARDRETVSEDDVDTLVLTNNNGRLVITGQEGDSASDVLADTIEKLATDPTIVSEDTDSDIPTSEFTNGPYHFLVQAYPLDGTVVVVTLRSREEVYPAALDSAQSDIAINGNPILSGTSIESVEPEATEEPPTPESSPTPPPAGTPVPTGDSGLNGTTFTSPGFGFTLEIPDGWTVDHEAIATGDEQLAVTNGTSLVTVHATNLVSGELGGCVNWVQSLFANDPAYQDIKLSVTPDGKAFRGTDDRRAYARYQYTGADGVVMALYVSCEPLEADSSVLIMTQQVPLDQFDTERGAWRQIRSAIVRP